MRQRSDLVHTRGNEWVGFADVGRGCLGRQGAQSEADVLLAEGG